MTKFANCESCILKPSLCHGIDGDLGVTGCAGLDHKNCAEWEWTCTCDPDRLAERIQEVGNFKCELRVSLRPNAPLPHYVPTIYHLIPGPILSYQRTSFEKYWASAQTQRLS
jgi:hypothetical protein